MPIEALKANTQKNKKNEINKTLKAVLVNNHIKSSNDTRFTFDDIEDSLLICNSSVYNTNKETENTEESSFDTKKALKPILAGTAIIAGGCLLLSGILKKSSNTLLKSSNFEQLPDLAVNMNIKEEPQFAIYRAIRDPNSKNIMGAIGIFLMSGITIACKNFVDGAKEIWIKKQSADIEKNLQENLIEVETNSFSGKLQVINNMLSKNIKHFDYALNSNNVKPNSYNVFSKISSFKGSKQKNNDENTNKISIIDKVSKDKNLKYLLMVAGVITGSVILGKLSFSNLKNTIGNCNKFANNYTEKTIDAIEKISNNTNEKDILTIKELLKSICAKPEFIKETLKKYNMSDLEIQNIIKEVEESKKTIFADAPTALGGIPKKIQYYCYIDENRGHLYNWILNPENKFTKYIFSAFTASSAIGYIFKQGMDAIKEVTVQKENAKTELDLRKRLVNTEIKNFKAKKESAIKPLVEDFDKNVASGKKSKEDLKQIADNILTEIKNGPPYVYT